MKTLVLGASENPERYSFLAVNRLLAHDHEVVAIGKKAGKIRDCIIQTGFPEIKDVHTITIYLNPQNQKQFYNYIKSLKPKRVIFNPGAENTELEEILSKNNVEVLEACTLVLLSTGQY